MKNKVYNVLSYLALAFFVIATSLFGLNYLVDTTAKEVNKEVEAYTADFNESFADGKVVHNLLVKNCNMQVCGKISFITMRLPSTEIETAEGVKEEKGKLIEIFSKNPITFSVNPLTQGIKFDNEDNEVVVFVDKEQQLHASYKELFAATSVDLFNYSKLLESGVELTLENVAKVVESEAEFEIKGLDVKFDNTSAKLDSFNFEMESNLASKDRLDSAYIIDLNNLELVLESEIENKVIMNFNLDYEVENATLKNTQEYMQITRDLIDLENIEVVSSEQEALIQKQYAKYLIGYAKLLLNSLETMHQHDTVFKLNNISFELFDTTKEKTLVSSLKSNGSFALDENLNPTADLNMNIYAENAEDNQENLDILFRVKDKKNTIQQIKPFVKIDERTSKTAIKAKDGKLYLNEAEPVDIDGVLKSYIQGAIGFVKMMQNIQ